MSTNLKLILVAVIFFLLGYFICKKNTVTHVEVQDPKYDSVSTIFSKYSKQITNPNSNFGGLEFSSDLLIGLASILDSTSKVQMLIGIDSNRQKVAYFKQVGYGKPEDNKPDYIYYISENKLLKFEKAKQPLFTFNDGSENPTSSMKIFFENVFTKATAANRPPPTCPPWDPRCRKVQASKVVGINTGESLIDNIESVE